jgi:hypothetical protein
VIDMVYGDMSGDENQVLSAACFLGHESEWMNAIAAWCRALDDAGVTEFHATDFFNAKGEFDDDRWRYWDSRRERMIPGGPEHTAFAERFTGIAVNNALIGFAFSLDGAAFKEFLAPELAKEKRQHSGADPKTLSIMNCLAVVGRFLAKAREEKDKIQVIFEHEHGAGRFVDFFDEAKSRREQFTYCFKTFTTAPKSFPPLQMADLLAHETWRRTKEIWSPSPRPLRKSFERMIADGQIQLDAMDRESCIKNAMAARDLMTRYPDGLIPATDTRKPQ